MIGRRGYQGLTRSDEDGQEPEVVQNPLPVQRMTSRTKQYIIGIFALSIVVRLLALSLSSPEAAGWYADTYHRWQIAIYTLNLGLPQGRMWDLLGLEYFWGPLPILTQSFLIWLLGPSVVPFRLLNIIVGSINVVIIYLLVRKYALPYPWLAGVLVAACPVLIFLDISGLGEPIAFLFLFGALFFYEKSPFMFGVCLAFASMSRIEFWPLSWGLIACYYIFRRSGTQMVPAVFGWGIPMAPYLYHLWIHTGDPLYPLRTSIAGDIVGQWLGPGHAPPLVMVWRALFIIIFIASAVGLVYLIKRKPKNYIIYAFILGNLALHGITFGFSAYSTGFQPYYFYDRLIVLEYIFIAFAAVPLLIKYVPMIFRSTNIQTVRRGFGAAVLVGVVLLYFFAGSFSAYMYVDQSNSDLRLFQVGNRVASLYSGGTIISDSVHITYRLINLGIDPHHILGSIYAPRDNLVDTYNWLLKEDVTIIIYSDRVATMLPALQDNQDHAPFYVILRDISTGTVVYRVDQSLLRSLAS